MAIRSKKVAVPWKRTIYIMFFAQIIMMIGFSSVFPFLPLYVKTLGSATGLSIDMLSGLVFSGQALTMMVASPIWGALADRWGRKLMVVRAAFGGAVILVLMAFVRSAEELVLLRMMQGLITGVIGAANALVAATVPRENTGYAMGLMQVGVGIGFGVGPMIGGAVADAFGYTAAFYITGALLIVAGVIVAWGVEERFVAARPSQGRRILFWHEWRRIFSTPGVSAAYGLRFINQMGRMIYVPVLPLYVMMLLKNPDRVNSFTGLIFGFSSAATAVFSVFLGRLGDRIGHHRILIASFLGCTLFFMAQSLVASGWQLLAAQVMTGVALGGIVPALSAMLAHLTRCGQEGAVYGLDGSITSGARVIGPMIGVGVASLFGLRAVFGASAALYMAAAFLAAFCLPRRPVQCEPQGEDRSGSPDGGEQDCAFLPRNTRKARKIGSDL